MEQENKKSEELIDLHWEVLQRIKDFKAGEEKRFDQKYQKEVKESE